MVMVLNSAVILVVVGYVADDLNDDHDEIDDHDLNDDHDEIEEDAMIEMENDETRKILSVVMVVVVVVVVVGSIMIPWVWVVGDRFFSMENLS